MSFQAVAIGASSQSLFEGPLIEQTSFPTLDAFF
jgi:hypothetical protein